jgi:hypothetical protein
MAPRSSGQTYFITKTISKTNTSICTMSVRLIFTVVS